MGTVHESKVDLFGDVGADCFDEALEAAHMFARATDCPPGGDVFRWLIEKHEALVFYENNLKRAPSTHQTGEPG